ncbi:MAG TPA: transposase, partial [Polyangiales bacterium]|nr:transposase [Polyangiales bacterium]
MRYVIRLKDNWKPKIQVIVRGSVSNTFAPGTDLDVLIADDVLRLDGKVIDADVELGPESIRARLVGVPTDKGYCFFLTNLPPDVAPRSVADLYRVRWEIELDNKLDKSACRLDEITARTASATRALVHASMVASMLACLLRTIIVAALRLHPNPVHSDWPHRFIRSRLHAHLQVG